MTFGEVPGLTIYDILFFFCHNKNERLQKVEIYICAIRDLSATMETEASMIITKIHPSLNDLYGISKNISDDILKKLNGTVVSLEEEKQKRLEKVKS